MVLLFCLSKMKGKNALVTCYLVVTRVRYSVGQQLTLGIPRKKLTYLYTKQRPSWLHVSFFNHFNQPLTINNIAALTRARHINPHIRVIQRRPSVRFGGVLFLFQAEGVIMAERLERCICNPAPRSSPALTASLSSFFSGAPIKIDKQGISYW